MPSATLRQIKPEMSVGEFLTRHPAAAPVLLGHDIDFCCCGSQGLAEACAQAGIDQEALLAQVAEAGEAGPSVRWDQRPIDALVEHVLEAHHRPLDGLLSRLGPLACHVAEVHGPTHGDELTRLSREVSTLCGELLQHMHKEEQVLFPWLLSGHGANAGGPVRVMLQEHDDASQALTRIRELTDDFQPPAGACASWRALLEQLAWLDRDLRIHIHLENNVLFPRALRGEKPRRSSTHASYQR